MSKKTELEELVDFLSDSNPEARRIAVQHVKALSSTKDVVDQLARTPVVPAVLRLTGMRATAGDAVAALVNLTEHPSLNREMIDRGTVVRSVEAMVDADTADDVVELYGMLLSNLTRSEEGVKALAQTGTKLSGLYIFKLLNALKKNRGDVAKLQAGLGWAGLILMNCTGQQEGRDCMLDESRAFLKLVVPLMSTESVLLRRSIAGTLKNCCFDHSRHAYILKEEFGLLTGLMFPLLPPAQFDAEDSAGMDPLLSSYDAKKRVEPDLETRLALVEALAQLTATEEGREIMRAKKVYPIIREMDKIEKDDGVHEAVFQVVDHLMSDEGGATPSPSTPAVGLKQLLQGVSREAKAKVEEERADADAKRAEEEKGKAAAETVGEEESEEEDSEEEGGIEDLLELD